MRIRDRLARFAHTVCMQRTSFLDWVVYQIYPRSFCDSNADGIGDLRGILQKLDHLQDLGINAVWLCPCYKSPQYDNGYDISDYRDIAEEFGTLSDWEDVKNALHERGIKLIMDLVVNHTSFMHPWFLQAKSGRDNPYHDYYIWAETPPNRWRSVFGGSAWEYNPQTQEYYLHSFAKEQPDLNWENPAVRKEVRDIVDFWVAKGVDGFRCDVLDYIAKDFKKNQMYNGEQLHSYVQELFHRKGLEKIFTIGECQSDEKSIRDICGKDRGELTCVFQFEHIRPTPKDKYTPPAFNLDKMRNILVKWQNFTAKHELLYVLFTDNHDYPFYLSRFGNDKALRYECATALATAFFLLKGIPFLYQGQEFGGANPYYEDTEAFLDVESVQYYQAQKNKKSQQRLLKELNYGSRDNTRRPMAWNADKDTNYGFSQGSPWIAVHSRAAEINGETDKNSKNSVFYFYKRLLSLRANCAVLRYGEFENLTKGNGYFAYLRTWKKKRVLVICNFEKARRIPFPKYLTEQSFHESLRNYHDRTPFSTQFRPYEIAVYEEF